MKSKKNFKKKNNYYKKNHDEIPIKEKRKRPKKFKKQNVYDILEEESYLEEIPLSDYDEEELMD